MSRRRVPPLALVLLFALAAEAASIEFNRDIRPILSENCFQCHGQDAARRKARLRLDDRADAIRDRDGYAVIAPGKPEDSELVRRIVSKDPDEAMPPAESHKTLTPGQVALLRRWVAEGALYEKHWAFIAPKRPALPEIRGVAASPQRAGFPRANAAPTQAGSESQPRPSPIDALVRARLAQHGLSPAPAAAPETWLRRASLDLTGLPPTIAELDRFAAEVAQRGEKAFADAADRLLASAHFGERQAIEWLDAARYADTHGFNNDSARSMWRWRDWVIEAFNANMPYDRFITEQLAGDLLPNPTLEQRIATGFGRNHVINSEGGIIDEEYRVEYVADRVRTVSTAWLGLTLECARCHDHKFDPIAQRDYYRLFAFFNNVAEHGEDGRIANAIPMMPAPTREQQALLAKQERELAELDAKLGALAARDSTPRPVHAGEAPPLPGADVLGKDNVDTGIVGRAWRPVEGQPAPKVPAAKMDFAGKDGVTVMFWLRPEAANARDVPLFSSMDHLGSPADTQFGKGRELRLIEGELELRLCARYPVYAVIVRTTGAAIAPGEWRHVAVTYSGGKNAAGVRIFVDGVELAVQTRYDGLQNEPPKRDFLIGADNAKDGARWRGELDEFRVVPRALAAAELRARFLADALPYAQTRMRTGEAGDRERHWLRQASLASEEASRELMARRTALWEEHLALRRTLPTVMTMQEMPAPRPAFVLTRGQYDAPGEPVSAGVPEGLLAAWPAGAPRNRLGLARWLTQPDHPLTARVVVNRFWAQLFGTGLVKTLEDFGFQSEWPSHPELLDWLAREFVDGGWDVKALLKTIVLSATYRQSSAVSRELAARDPENRLLARGPRVRLPAELIRDQALAVSGLLAPRVGGPSVYPYQPDKIYEQIVVGAEYPGTKWLLSHGEDLHRRSLYTFWKRTMPHPAMLTFDAPDREFCSVRRSRTNTPLQALVLWNEPGQLEAARHLGGRLLREGGAEDPARVAFAFRAATGRSPTAKETRVLVEALARFRADFVKNPDETMDLINVGATPIDTKLPPAELAAATSVASMILSLDEVITKN